MAESLKSKADALSTVMIPADSRVVRVLLFKKYFLGFSVTGKVFQNYPAPLILVCCDAMSTPWDAIVERT